MPMSEDTRLREDTRLSNLFDGYATSCLLQELQRRIECERFAKFSTADLASELRRRTGRED